MYVVELIREISPKLNIDVAIYLRVHGQEKCRKEQIIENDILSSVQQTICRLGPTKMLTVVRKIFFQYCTLDYLA